MAGEGLNLSIFTLVAMALHEKQGLQFSQLGSLRIPNKWAEALVTKGFDKKIRERMSSWAAGKGYKGLKRIGGKKHVLVSCYLSFVRRE